jgi:mevalonate kinase
LREKYKDNMNKTSAPAKTILFGEHSVVYNRLGIATTIDKRCFVTVDSNHENNISIDSKGLNLKQSLTQGELSNLFEYVEELKSKKDFKNLKEMGEKDRLSPSLFIIAHLMRDDFTPIRIIDKSEIPKNFGSSSSAYAAIALGVSKFLGKDLSKKEISDLAYQGDIIAHGGTPSGIDSSIVTYGGYIQYKKSEGIRPLNIDFKLPLLFVESGEKARTGETVTCVRQQRERDEKSVDRIFDSINSISEQALDFLKSQNLEPLGRLMTRHYTELRKLDISTPKLDQIIEIAVKNKAFGAKPTGGWGGGCCIVLAKNQSQADELMKIYKERGFNSFQAKIGVEGVKDEF